ncbi:KDO2-lipid IV(A) lauroyltransferase [Filimonas zeae]|uniref:Acetyltransferase n=1 Tax=Filimonas zeae TaxID=1737353 RepID=A0A917MZD3_9BACT|nr:lipid A biosynthesis acyltransferase [Filimonas zeae]MDR6342505.1 KDO2-lipid IV(A) lauroyltransferase [Filimonas zeae]GGH81588.1 acetyltransferase [Filimonas zeae]
MYRIVYSALYLVSLLPFRALYLLSDFAAFLLYAVIRYRRDVVLSNLKTAFPEKTDKELEAITREFYVNFTDNFIETIKLLSISEKALRKRLSVDTSVLKQVYAKGQKVEISLGHFFNWEIANMAFSLNNPFDQLVVYMPISNKIMERMFVHLRTRFGSKLIAASNFRREITPYLRKQHCLILVADQNAGAAEQAYWLPFFGKMASFVTGPEKNAKMNDAAVVMGCIKRVKRGYYSATLTLLTAEPKSMPNGAITKALASHIEQCIREQPANYLWSHRRWKTPFDAEKHGHLVLE